MKLGLRFLIPMAGLTVFAANTPAADVMSHSGNARTRLELTKNYDGTDTAWAETWLNRVTLNLDFSPSKTLKVRISPEATHTFGAVGGSDDMLFTAGEAWMSWQASDMVSIIAGRQAWNFGKGLIIGYNDWSNSSNYFDSARVHLTFDMGTTDIFLSKVAENEGAGASANKADHDVFGFYTILSPDMGMVKTLDLYFIWNDNRAISASRARFGTLGVRAEGDAGMIDYNVEITGQMGKTGSNGKTDMKGLQMDLTAGAKLMDVHHVALNLAYANSEFTNLYPSNHVQLGRADIVSRKNLYAIGILTNWKLADAWKAGVDGYYFMAANDKTGNGGGLTTVASERAIGMEGDLTLAYSPEKNLTFEFGYDFFKGGDAVKPSDEMVSKVYLQGSLDF